MTSLIETDEARALRKRIDDAEDIYAEGDGSIWPPPSALLAGLSDCDKSETETTTA